MIINLIALLIGLSVLAISSRICVKYTIKFANLVGISKMALGFVLLGVSTSIPELMVTIIASLQHKAMLGIGTLLGANIADMLIIAGIGMLMVSFAISKKDFNEIYRAIGVATLMAVFAVAMGTLGSSFGFFAIIMFGFSVMAIMKNGVPLGKKDDIVLPTVELLKIIFMVSASITAVVIGAYVAVNSAGAIAGMLSISETLIGFSILAIGTTLPELAVTVAAVRTGNFSLAIGNIVGSLVTNLTLILGIGTIISTATLGAADTTAFMLIIIVNALFLALSMRMKFDKISGAVLMMAYALSLIILFMA